MGHIETLLRACEALRAAVSPCLARSGLDPVKACVLSYVSWRALDGKLSLDGRYESFSSLSRLPVAPWAKRVFGSLHNAYVTVLPLLKRCLDRHPTVIGLADNHALSPKGHTHTRIRTI